MTSKIVTLTSKNQITLPIEFVRKFNLGRNRTLQATEKNGTLELKPSQSVEEIMAPIWEAAAKHMKRPATDDELSRAARDAYAGIRWDNER